MADRLDEAMDALAQAVVAASGSLPEEAPALHARMAAARQAVREARCADCRVGSGRDSTSLGETQGASSTVPPLPADVRGLVERLDEADAGEYDVIVERASGRLNLALAPHSPDRCLNLTELCRQAAAALRATAEDTARLDWLAEGPRVKWDIWDDGRTTIYVEDEDSMDAPSLRAAIDAARRGQEGTER